MLSLNIHININKYNFLMLFKQKALPLFAFTKAWCQQAATIGISLLFGLEEWPERSLGVGSLVGIGRGRCETTPGLGN